MRTVNDESRTERSDSIEKTESLLSESEDVSDSASDKGVCTSRKGKKFKVKACLLGYLHH